MKILYHHRVASKDGQYVHIAEIINSLRKLGHEVIVCEPNSIQSTKFGGDSNTVPYHNLLYFDLIEQAIVPCGQGPSCSGAGMTLFGAVPIPLLSLGAFTAIVLLMLLLQKRLTK